MGYKVIPQIQKSERTIWSPERGGRVWQMVGGKKVKKFAFSPYTAKAYTGYTFYADIEMEKEIESPPDSGVMRKTFTVPAFTGTFIDFRREVIAGETYDRLTDLVESVGGGRVIGVTYWRNKGEKADEE